MGLLKQAGQPKGAIQDKKRGEERKNSSPAKQQVDGYFQIYMTGGQKGRRIERDMEGIR